MRSRSDILKGLETSELAVEDVEKVRQASVNNLIRIEFYQHRLRFLRMLTPQNFLATINRILTKRDKPRTQQIEVQQEAHGLTLSSEAIPTLEVHSSSVKSIMKGIPAQLDDNIFALKFHPDGGAINEAKYHHLLR